MNSGIIFYMETYSLHSYTIYKAIYMHENNFLYLRKVKKVKVSYIF